MIVRGMRLCPQLWVDDDWLGPLTRCLAMRHDNEFNVNDLANILHAMSALLFFKDDVTSDWSFRNAILDFYRFTWF